MIFCSYRGLKPKISPSHSSKVQRRAQAPSSLLPPLPPNGRKLSRCKSSGAGAPQAPANIIPSPVLPTTPKSTDSTTFFLLYYALAACCPLPRGNLPSHSQSLALSRLAPSPEAPSTYLQLDNYNSSLFNFNFY